MTKEELAVDATFLVAELRKEIAGLEQCEVYADNASMSLPLEDAKSNNRTDTDASIAKKTPFFGQKLDNKLLESHESRRQADVRRSNRAYQRREHTGRFNENSVGLKCAVADSRI